MIEGHVDDLSIMIPIVTGLTAVIRRFGLPEKYMPIPSIVFGIIFSLVYIDHEDIKYKVLGGLIIGLSASGLYKHTQKLYAKKEGQTKSHKGDAL